MPFEQMQTFIDELRQEILGLRLQNRGFDDEGEEGEEGHDEEGEAEVEEATEAFDKSPRAHRKSLIGAAAPLIDVGGPRSPMLERERKVDEEGGSGFAFE